jgi:epoxyqueuosine reductase
MATMDGLTLRERVLAELRDIDLFGVAAVADAEGTPLAEAARLLLPGARAIVVLAAELFPEILRLVEPEKQVGVAAARDLYTPHVDYLSGRMHRGLYAVAKLLRAEGYHTIPLPSQGTPTDARFQRGILSFKHAAEYAGLGRIGRSSLLVTEGFGPRVRLACLLTDAPLPSTRREVPNPCADCGGACIQRCPAGALADPPPGVPYTINKFACASFRGAAGACSSCMAECVRA